MQGWLLTPLLYTAGIFLDAEDWLQLSNALIAFASVVFVHNVCCRCDAHDPCCSSTTYHRSLCNELGSLPLPIFPRLQRGDSFDGGSNCCLSVGMPVDQSQQLVDSPLWIISGQKQCLFTHLSLSWARDVNTNYIALYLQEQAHASHKDSGEWECSKMRIIA